MSDEEKGKAGEEKNIQVEAMMIKKYPRKEDIFGEAGIFVEDFIRDMETEFLYNAMGTSPNKTFLITGKHGLGKTLGVEALINEANREPFDKLKEGITEGTSINLLGFPYDIGRYGTKYINEGSTRMQEFFDVVLLHAQNGIKSVAIFDEADVVFGKRGQGSGSHKEDEKVLNTIMKNIQKVHDTPNAYAIMMSNFPEAFDEASIRAGRIDGKYEFGMPNYNERQQAYQATIRKINNKALHAVIRGYDTDALAKISDDFSYADIVESTEAAVKRKVREIARTKTNKIIPAQFITQKGLVASVEGHKKMFIKGKKKMDIGFER